MVGRRRPLACPLPVLTLSWAFSHGLDLLLCAECVRRFFSCFQFKEMPCKEWLLIRISCSILLFYF